MNEKQTEENVSAKASPSSISEKVCNNSNTKTTKSSTTTKGRGRVQKFRDRSVSGISAGELAGNAGRVARSGVR